MLQYIIDGYNVVHRIPDVCRSDTPCRALIAFIKNNRLTGSHNNKVVVVFDGAPQDGLRSEPYFQIAFSLERTADDVIKDKVSLLNNNEQVIVVSNDHEIKDYARACRVTVMSADEFVAKADPKPLPRSSRPYGNAKNISQRDQDEITNEMMKIWLKQ